MTPSLGIEARPHWWAESALTTAPSRLRFMSQCSLALTISNRPFIQIDSGAVRTKTIETRWNECDKYLHIIHFPLSLSSTPLFKAEFYYIEKGLLMRQQINTNQMFFLLIRRENRCKITSLQCREQGNATHKCDRVRQEPGTHWCSRTTASTLNSR